MAEHSNDCRLPGSHWNAPRTAPLTGVSIFGNHFTSFDRRNTPNLPWMIEKTRTFTEDGYALHYSKDRQCVDIELPYNSRSLFLTTGSPRMDEVGAQPINPSNALALVVYSSRTRTSTDSSSIPPLHIRSAWRATGEDFRFYFMRGPSPSIICDRLVACPATSMGEGHLYPCMGVVTMAS